MIKRATVTTFIITTILISISIYVAFQSIEGQIELSDQFKRTSERVNLMEQLESAIKDGETGQRGYLLKGKAEYLEPFNSSKVDVEESLHELREICQSGRDIARLKRLEELIPKKYAEMSQTIALRDKSFDASVAVVNTDVGMHYMEEIRTILSQMIAEQEAILDIRSSNITFKFRETINFYLFLSMVLWVLIAALKIFIVIQLDKMNSYQSHVLRLNRELEEKNESLEQYSWVAAHDLKEPVRVMGTYAELVAEEYADKLDKDGVFMLETITKSARDSLNRIDAVLKFSGVRKEAMQFEIIDLPKLIETVIASMNFVIEESGASVDVQGSARIRGDRELLQLSIQNLIENSIKYKSDADPEVMFSIEEDDQSGSVIVKVEDNGVGLQGADPNQVFGMFKRLESEKPGTGLGLSIVRKVISAHEGEIWFDDHHANGACFYLKFPQVEKEEDA